MESRNQKIVRCSQCGVELSVPPSARSIRCPACSGVTRIRRGPAGFVKHIVANISSGVASALSGYAAPSNSAGGTVQRGCEHPNPATAGYSGGYPAAHGKKRAVLIGINYTGTRYELKGSVNDVNCMCYLLCTKFGFPRECILVLTEEERDARRIPTRENVLAAMRWLVQGCTAGESLVFHFSGHGVQKLDVDGDDKDGFDEGLCPLDFEANGMILDDEINATIVRPLPRHVKLHAVVDACHSGTVLDLPYLCRISRTGFCQWENHKPQSGEYKGTSGGLAILISGCSDNQTSADTSALAGSTSTGAMTFSFIQAVDSESAPTYGSLLTAMRGAIRKGVTRAGISGPIASLVRKVLTFSSAQEPQLSSSEIFDIYKEPFLL